MATFEQKVADFENFILATLQESLAKSSEEREREEDEVADELSGNGFHKKKGDTFQF